MDKEHPPYHLFQSLMHHTGAARAVDIQGNHLLSGGIDRRLNHYIRDATTKKFTFDAEFPFFKDYIMFVKIMDGEKFAVACKDKNIYICSFDDKKGPMIVLEGHTGPVCSLDFRGTTLISGSWDATAKIWDLESGQCVKTLEGHSHAVTVCLTEKGDILTGSQDGNLNLWTKDGKRIKCIQAHTNIIRAIVEIPLMGFLTCSNDSKVKLFSLDLDELMAFEDATTFLFTVNFLAKESVDFAAGGEDFKLSIYRGGKKVQDLAFPNTVWCVAVDRENDNDLVVACGDSSIRIFSLNPDRKATEEEIHTLNSEAEMAIMKGAGELDEKTIKSFPTVEQSKGIKGKKDGEMKVFREGYVPKAYMWKTDKWEYVGEVMAQGAANKKHYHGDRFFPKGEYDHVFDVDVAEGAPKAKLPYNEGDNPLVVAEKFLTREGMHLGYKEQITDFIRKNTSGGGKPLPGGQSTSAGTSAAPKHKSCFPLHQTVFYDQMNLDGLQKKMEEFHNALHEAKNPHALTEHEVKYVYSIISKLRDPALYAYLKEFSSFEIQVAQKILKWPPENFVPVLDLWRCIVVHHASQVFFSGVDSGMTIIASIIGKLKTGPPILWTLFFKFLANLFMHTSNSLAVVRAKDIINEAFKQVNMQDAKVMALCADFLMNCGTTIEAMPGVSESFIEEYIALIGTIVDKATTLDGQSLLKLAIALGNLAVFKGSQSAKPIAAKLAEKLSNLTDDTSKMVVESLKNL
jgi:phospholipase A-2-activating protein